MNSTGVAIATSPCQPHHLHCLRVPSTPFLSPSLAPPQGTSGASAISHEATRAWLPACPLSALPPSFQPCLPGTQKPSPDPTASPRLFCPLPPHPVTHAPRARSPKSSSIRRLGEGWCFHQDVPPCVHLLQVIPQCTGGTIASNVCAQTNTTLGETLTAKDRQEGPVPLLYLPGHKIPLLAGQSSRHLQVVRDLL